MSKKGKSYAQVLESISTNISTIRKSRQLTQEDMTEFGFNYRHYQKLESGEYSPNLKTLHKLAEAFNVNLSDLLKGC
ncbi:MAG: helix-turn-helix transcriptional regulator [Pseudobdellovibrio sp.]